MKKFILCCLCAIACIGCNKQEQEVLKTRKWADVTKQYAFLQDFPAYNYELENVHYNNAYGMEQLSFFDYDCPTAHFEAYKTQLGQSAFSITSDMGNSMMYEQQIDNIKLIILLTYTGNNLACQYTRTAN
ncbi:MAG: hypothetical protein NC038_02790 [Paludibacter sp.]|nr:hypothetical protein [Bacteroidales bacterium]MCM1069004.1 hypothetical protein [Prevotella sp.]MCM1353667.1 hypothetical protein [Bacteroides sp.]MCM1441984.1 hypothetical protein [Muribaculum sp.]MCM1481560.1 hypothetical protein [Paludibacter sp.]